MNVVLFNTFWLAVIGACFGAIRGGSLDYLRPKPGEQRCATSDECLEDECCIQVPTHINLNWPFSGIGKRQEVGLPEVPTPPSVPYTDGPVRDSEVNVTRHENAFPTQAPGWWNQYTSPPRTTPDISGQLAGLLALANKTTHISGPVKTPQKNGVCRVMSTEGTPCVQRGFSYRCPCAEGLSCLESSAPSTSPLMVSFFDFFKPSQKYACQPSL